METEQTRASQNPRHLSIASLISFKTHTDQPNKQMQLKQMLPN